MITLKSPQIKIAQMQLTPENVALKSLDLQAAAIWGIKVSTFMLSLFMLLSLVRFIFNVTTTPDKKK